jgi:nitroreductase
MPYRPRPLDFARLPADEMRARARAMRLELARRRSVRRFSSEPIPDGVLEDCLLAAGSAPSGAHQQPWTFVVVSDPEVKRRVREAAEAEERRNYHERMSPEWLEALEVLGTDWHKEHLTDAPRLVVVFEQVHGVRVEPDGSRRRIKHYYAHESVGIAVGFLLAALHHAGLATLTHTPSPMGFLRKLLGRPDHERPFVLIPVGYPAPDAQVPDLARKPLDELAVWIGPR